MVAGLRLAYGLQPESWFFVSRNEQIIALVGAYDYGPVASIGMMAVAPWAQRQGVGEKLLVELLGYLEGRGCPLLFLDASAAGQRLYPKLGFVPEGETVRTEACRIRFDMLWTRPFSVAKISRGNGSGAELEVTRLEEGDLVEVAAFDAPIFGADRGAVIRSFWSGCPDRAFVVRDAGDGIAGYLIAGGNHIGPWAAATRERCGCALVCGAGAAV